MILVPPFRYTHIKIRTWVVVICDPTCYRLNHEGAPRSDGGGTIVKDNILIAGKDRQHHDSILKQAIERACTFNLKLNVEKCHTCQATVPYVGHMVIRKGLKQIQKKLKRFKKCQYQPAKMTFDVS